MGSSRTLLYAAVGLGVLIVGGTTAAVFAGRRAPAPAGSSDPAAASDTPPATAASAALPSPVASDDRPLRGPLFEIDPNASASARPSDVPIAASPTDTVATTPVGSGRFLRGRRVPPTPFRTSAETDAACQLAASYRARGMATEEVKAANKCRAGGGSY